MRFLSTLFSVFVFAASQPCFSAPVETMLSPEALVAQNSQQIETLLSQLDTPRKLEEVAEIFEHYLFPHIDQERITKLVLGKHWKKSSLKQKRAFQACFLREINTTYAEIFTEQELGKATLTETIYNDTRSKAAVTIKLATDNSETELVFRLYKSSKHWLYYDVTIDGISLVKNYRDVYTQRILKQGLAKTLAALCKAYPDKTPLVVLAGHTWPPYIGQGLPGGGFAVELVKHVMAIAGYKSKMVFAPWQTVGKKLERGDFDLSVSTWKTSEREKTFLYTDSFYTNELIVAHPKDSQIKPPNNKQQIQALLKQQKIRLGGMTDYGYGDLIPEASKLILADKYSLQFRKLATGKLDFLLLEKQVAHYHNKLNPALKKRVQLGNTILERKALHATALRSNPRSKQLIKDFNEAWKAYKNSPQHKALLQKYRISLH